jgi:prevent-host-death family protein
MQAPIAKVKRDLCKLVDRVERGESIVILRHGEPVARIVPMPGRGKPWRVEKADDPKLYRGLDLDAPVLDEI